MSQTTARTEVRRRLGTLTDSEPPTSPTESKPHGPRWNQESIDPDPPDSAQPETFTPAPRPPAATGPRASSGCRADGWEHDASNDDPQPRGGSSSPTWLSEPDGNTAPWHERLVPDKFRGTRWDPGPRGALVLALVAAFVVLLAGVTALREKPVAHAVPPITPAGATSVPGAKVSTDGGPTARPTLPVPSPPSEAPAPAANPAGNPAGTTSPDATGHPAPTGELVVSVIGMVEYGGLRRFPPGSRIADALKAAAPLPAADLSTLNLAQPLCDGDQIVVGKPTPRPSQVATTIINAARTPNTTTISGAPRTSTAPAKVNLNTATEPELDALPGVGPITARSILTWRTQHGRFTSIDQLAEIDGIGPTRLARLRQSVTI